MAIASTSYSIQDHSPSYAMQMRLDNKLFNDSPCSSRYFGEFDTLDGFRQQLAGTGNASYLEKESYPASLVPLSCAGTSAISSEIAHIIHGRVVSVPTSHHLSIGHESIGRGLPGDFSSFDVNEFADCGDIRLCSQEMATAAVPPPQRHEWIEGSTSYITSRDSTMPTTVSVDFERPLGQRSYTVPTCTETSAGEGNSLESPQPFQHEQSSHSTQPVATNGTSEGFYRPWINHGSPWTSTSDVILPLSSGPQMETTEKTMSVSLQPSTSKKSRLYSQTVESDRIRDSAAVQNLRDIVDVSKVQGPRQHHFVQQELCLSMSTSRDLHEGHQPRQCRIRGKAHQFSNENLNRLKLKQKSLAKPLPRKYQRRQILYGIGTKYKEVDHVSKPRDHVERERKRRDIMTSKVAALDLLLPKSSKRDRVSVVYDAIQLVQKLQRDVKDLQKKFHEAKLLRARRKQSRGPGRVLIPESIDYNMDTSRIVIKQVGTYMKQVAMRTQHTRDASGKSRLTHISSITQHSGGSNVPDKFVEFRVHLDDKVTAQEAKIWKCRCRQDYLSRMIVVMEDFQLDLTSCNILKLSGYFICSMGLRARTRADPISAAQFAVRLQSVVDVDTASDSMELEPEYRMPKSREWARKA